MKKLTSGDDSEKSRIAVEVLSATTFYYVVSYLLTYLFVIYIFYKRTFTASRVVELQHDTVNFFVLEFFFEEGRQILKPGL